MSMGTAVLRFLIKTERLDGELRDRLHGEMIGHPETPGFVQVRSGGVECAGEIIGGAAAVLNAEIVVPAKQVVVVAAMNQPDGPTGGTLHPEPDAIRVKDIMNGAAASLRVIK